MKVTLSKDYWVEMGIRAGWIKTAQIDPTKPVETPTSAIPDSTPEPASKLAPTPFQPTVGEEEIKPKEEMMANLRVTLESAETKYGILTWLVVRNTTQELAEDLKSFGFKAFRNRVTGEWEWSLGEKKAREIRPQLEAQGINCSALDAPAIKKEKSADVLPVAEEEELEGLDLPPELIAWHKEMKEAKKLDVKERKKRYTEIIAEALKKMGEEVENPEVIAQSQAILKTMLNASSKFHNYSFWNSLMIAIMRPSTSYAASEKAWRKMGRVPKAGAVRIPVMFPYSRKVSDDQKQNMSDQQIASASRTFFGIGSTLAFEDTMPIPNWKNEKGEGPFEAPEWEINSNEATDWLTRLYSAAYKWGTDVKKFKIETGTTGLAAGWSAGGRIMITDKADGVRKVSTLFHELAHELLHWDNKFLREGTSKQERETEAELVSYVVCSHYHIENKNTSLYLAGYRANKELIHSRLRNVQKAAVEIFEGVDSTMAMEPVEQAKDVAQPTQEPTDFVTPDAPKAEVKASTMSYFLNNYIGKLGL